MDQFSDALLFTALDAGGNPISGARLYFYLAGTLTDAIVFADSDGITELSQPVVADSAGRFPNIYRAAGVNYRAVLHDGADVLIRDFGTISSSASVGPGDLQDGAVTAPAMADDSVPQRAIQAGAVGNAESADMAPGTFKGRTTGTGPPEDLTGTEATALLDAAVGAGGSDGLKGLVPKPLIADAAHYLRGDMTYHDPIDHTIPIVKAGAIFDITAPNTGGAAVSLLKAYGGAAVARLSAGVFTLTVAAGVFADGLYWPFVIVQKATANDALEVVIERTASPTATVFTIGVADNTASAQDPAHVRVLLFDA